MRGLNKGTGSIWVIGEWVQQRGRSLKCPRNPQRKEAAGEGIWVWNFLGSNPRCAMYKLNGCINSLTVLNLRFPPV